MLRPRRPGFTLMEMMAVLAVLVIIGAVVVPSMHGFYGNTKQRAAADILRTRLAEARSKAMERGIPFRVAINSDKTRIRVAPDSDDFSTVTPDNPPGLDSLATEDTLDEGTVEIVTDQNDTRPPDSGGWVTVATMRADSSAKETFSVIVNVKQRDFPPIQVQVRGITGQACIVANTKNGSQQ